MSGEQPTVVFLPRGSPGPIGHCTGIGGELLERGARVVFIVDESFAGTLETKGFEEALVPFPPPPQDPGPGKDFEKEIAPVLREPAFLQLKDFIKPTWERLVAGAKFANAQLTEVFEELQPDVIVEDNLTAFPAIPASKAPWVRVVSSNPLEMKDPNLPPPYSGLATEERSGWVQFRMEYRETLRRLQHDFSDFCREQCGLPLPEPEFMFESPYLNLYVYPRELDYERSAPLGPTWHRLESCVHEPGAPFELPEPLRGGEGKLIYLSLGPLGSADTQLMNRVVGLLANTRHRVVVNTGSPPGSIDLPDNMWGEESFPQTSILPQVDLVVTNGENGTVTECVYFGRPMLVLPLVWDQHDNARRVKETLFGVQLSTYGFSEMEFYTAIDGLLSDSDLHAHLREAAVRLQAEPGTRTGADLILRLASEKAPIVD